MSNRKYQINEEYFNNWSNEMAYLLGFLAADGNVYKSTLSISLQKRDDYVLEFFMKEIGKTSKNYRTIKKRKYTRIRFNSKKIIDSLKKYQITPAKTLTLRANFDIPKQFLGDFIRGIFDGDGWVNCRRNSIECGICSASELFLKDITKLIKIKGRIRKRIKTKDSKPLYCWEINKTDTMKLKNIMYADENCFCLKRKKEKFFSNFYCKSECFWSDDEISFLKENYKKNTRGNIQFISNNLPKRSYRSIAKKVWELQLAQ